MRLVLALVAVLALGACKTLNNPQACSDAQSKLKNAQAALDAANAAIPGLQTVVTTACSDKTSNACKNAETALTVGQALIPSLQAALSVEQSNVNSQCISQPS